MMDTSNEKLYGLIKQIESGEAYNNEKHKSEYDKLCTFVIEFV